MNLPYITIYISKLQGQAQQISLSQGVTKNELEVKMDGIEEKMKRNMEDLKNCLKADMESLKEGLEKLLQEMLPSGDKVLHENQDEDKRNMKYVFKDSNIGFKTHHNLKRYMRKFDDKDMITCILQME